MINHINLVAVLFFVGIIVICIITLFLTFPNAFKEYKEYSASRRKPEHIKDINDQSITRMFEELSLCTKPERIKTLIGKLEDAANDILQTASNPLRIKHADTIITWINNFSEEAHIQDIKKNKFSRQVQFNNNKTFKLLIIDKKTP